MLIFTDEQRERAGIKSLSKQCPYCRQALRAYPLILSDDAGFFVYHAACAAALATEILIDLYTFFRPPAPYQQLFMLDPRQEAVAYKKVETCAVNGSGRDESRAVGASVSSVYTGELGRGASHGGQKEQGAPAGPAPGTARWYPADAVTIEYPEQCPTGACDLEDGPDERSILPKPEA